MGKKSINPIKNGTVIDHIPANRGRNVWEILSLPVSEEKEFLGMKLTSSKLGRKDILMFENLELDPEQLRAIALIAPQVTISIIEKGEIKEKIKVSLPSIVKKIITCPNPHCITNIEKVETNFIVKNNGKIEVFCHYCEKKYPIDRVTIKM